MHWKSMLWWLNKSSEEEDFQSFFRRIKWNYEWFYFKMILFHWWAIFQSHKQNQCTVELQNKQPSYQKPWTIHLWPKYNFPKGKSKGLLTSCSVKTTLYTKNTVYMHNATEYLLQLNWDREKKWIVNNGLLCLEPNL